MIAGDDDDAKQLPPRRTRPGGLTDEPAVGPDDRIFSRLRKLYDDVAAEPLPDHLLDLLKKLDEAERKR